MLIGRIGSPATVHLRAVEGTMYELAVGNWSVRDEEDARADKI